MLRPEVRGTGKARGGVLFGRAVQDLWTVDARLDAGWCWWWSRLGERQIWVKGGWSEESVQAKRLWGCIADSTEDMDMDKQDTRCRCQDQEEEEEGVPRTVGARTNNDQNRGAERVRCDRLVVLNVRMSEGTVKVLCVWSICIESRFVYFVDVVNRRRIKGFQEREQPISSTAGSGM